MEVPITKTSQLTPAFYTVKEAAIVLHVGEKTIRRWILLNKLRVSNATRKKLIPRGDVDRFFERNH